MRGPWADGSWRGWRGNNPPYHAPTFVLTHHEREPLVMGGGTTFGSVHLACVPVLHGQGEPLLHGLDLHTLGVCVTDRKASEYATHFVLEKVAIQS